MEKIKPYLLPGLLIFYLVFSVGMIPIGYLVNRVGNARVAHFLLAAGLVVLASQWLLATIWTTFGPGKFLQRLIPCFLCVLLALLAFEQSRCLMSWGDDAMIPRWKFLGWIFVFVPAATWVLVVITLYILRIIPGMRWCLTINGDERQLTSPPVRRLSRLGLLCLAVTACGAVVMANRTLFQATGWTDTIADFALDDSQPTFSLVLALLAAISVSILVLMNLTLSRFTDWILYRRNWLIFATLITTFTACVVCIFKSTHTHDIESPLTGAALLLGLLLTQLLVGVAGYRLRYRRPDNHTNLASPPGSLIQPTTETRQTWGHGPLDKLAIIGALAILAISIPTGFHKKMTVMNFGQATPLLGFLDGELIGVEIHPAGTVRSFSFLDGYPNVVVLRIHGRDAHINEAGMRSLQRLHQNLQFGLGGLNIWYCGFDADHLQYIADFTRLKDLNLWNTPTTDASLVHLEGLTNLKTLHLGDTFVTDAGVAKLQKALPNCRIIH